jgi:RNA polymerase sigma-70 factor, ECF subfamily
MKKSRTENFDDSNSGELGEAEAVHLAQQGDAAGFERLYRLNSRRVYTLCLRMTRNAADAEDLTQEVFLQTFRKIGSFRGESQFSTWLHRVTANVVLMHLRKRRRSESHLDRTSEGKESSDTPTVEFGTVDLHLQGVVDRVSLEGAIAQLPQGYKRMLLLNLEGYEHNEIAQIVGCSIGNSKSQLHKARCRLRDLLSEGPADRQPGGDLSTTDSAAGSNPVSEPTEGIVSTYESVRS